jgi:hypothetical protein
MSPARFAAASGPRARRRSLQDIMDAAPVQRRIVCRGEPCERRWAFSTAPHRLIVGEVSFWGRIARKPIEESRERG